MENKIFIVVITLLLFSNFSFAADNAPAKNTPEYFKNIGDSLLKQKKNSEASDAYRKALALNPNMSSAHFGLGRVFSRLKDYNKAIEQMEFALKLDENISKEVLPHLVLLYLWRSDVKSVAYLKQLLEIDQGLGSRLVPMVINARIYGMRETDSAFEVGYYFPVSTNWVMDAMRKADSFIDSGEFEKAISAYKELILKEGLMPKEKAVVLHTIGTIYVIDLNKPQEAILYLKQALELNPEELPFIIGLVDAYRSLREYSKALDEIEKLLKREPNSKYGLYMQGVLYLKMGNWVKAVESLDKLKKIDSILFAFMEEEYTAAKHFSGTFTLSGNIPTKTWQGTKEGIKIKYPDGWFIKKAGSGNVFQVFLSLENIDQAKYYTTGIMVTKIHQYLKEGAGVSGDGFIDEMIKSLEERNGLLRESRYNITTNQGYEGVLAKIKFVNFKGKKEIEWVGVFVRGTTMVNVICEAPAEDFSKYDSIFLEIILNAKLF